jgi:hypothetical protein
MIMRKRRYDEGGEVDPMEAANASAESQDIAKSMGAGPKMQEASKAAPKPRIVSKKELEDSGLSLRDYLNRERGLKRRAEKDPTAGDSPDRAAQEAADAIDPGRDMRVPRRYNSIMERSPQERDDMLKLGLQRQAAERAMKEFKAKKTAGMKSGGSVSSASRRADGIATKGKTRGKMC